MKKTKHYIAYAAFLLTLVNPLFCFEAIPTSELLLSYLQNDTDLKKNTIETKKAQLSLDSTKIKNGFDITLSTGTITFNTNQDGTGITVKPSVTAKIPQASGLSVTASSNIDIQDETTIKDNKLNASVDIISSSGLTRKIDLLKAERNYTEATRKLRNQAITAEKEFYTELKSLLSSAKSLMTATQTFYTNSIDFEKIKTQGYSEKSSTYRLAQMKVLSGEHELENLKRSLNHDFIMFYKKCGIEISTEEEIQFEQLIPSDITDPEIIDIHSFAEESYAEIESALWTNKINTMQRNANKNFTLSANGGLTFNNSVSSSTTIDLGLGTTIGGVNLDAGVNFPVSSDNTPSFTLSASLSPNTFRQNSITRQQNQLEEEQELLNIQIARTNYENKIFDMEQNLSDLNWTIQNDNESYEMYAQLEKDLYSWYKQGIITRSEYLSAKVNAETYSIKKIMNTIDLIIYNDTAQTMFVEEMQEN